MNQLTDFCELRHEWQATGDDRTSMVSISLLSIIPIWLPC